MSTIRISRPPLPVPAPTSRSALLPLVVAGVAFAARLVPVLRGGGLLGLGNYDDGVYYSAAVALTHGQLPYRSFLFLHPPGIILALVPFAALGHVTSDPAGFAVARLAFMALGALSAVLVTRVLRPWGTFAATFGGLMYALWDPAVRDEHTTLLETPGNLCVIGALALLASGTARSRQALALTAAGVLLGLSTGVKIWGMASVACVAGVLLVTAGRRAARRVVVGAALGVAVVCGPFLLLAPAAMTRYVLRDQLGRPRDPWLPLHRISAMLGLAQAARAPQVGVLLVLGLGCALGAMVLAWCIPELRLAVALLATHAVVLLASPSWFPHYAGFVAAPAAVTAGGAIARAGALIRLGRPRLVPLAASASLLGLVVVAGPALAVPYGQPFPGPAFAPAIAGRPGCVTADDPTPLVLMNVLHRNLERGCPLHVDVIGALYDSLDARRPDGSAQTRRQNRGWQRYLRHYLTSGSATILVRRAADQLTPATAAVLRHLPVLARSRSFTLYGRSTR